MFCISHLHTFLQASFVVCRVFVRSRGPNSISEHALSSCAEESIATVRHIGIQHDGSNVSVMDDDKALGCDYVNGKITGQPPNLIDETEPNNLVIPFSLESELIYLDVLYILMLYLYVRYAMWLLNIEIFFNSV